jgi:hypothetical protein
MSINIHDVLELFPSARVGVLVLENAGHSITAKLVCL